jgi:hypothetical protein
VNKGLISLVSPSSRIIFLPSEHLWVLCHSYPHLSAWRSFSSHLTSIIKLPGHVVVHLDLAEWSRWRNDRGDQKFVLDPQTTRVLTGVLLPFYTTTVFCQIPPESLVRYQYFDCTQSSEVTDPVNYVVIEPQGSTPLIRNPSTGQDVEPIPSIFRPHNLSDPSTPQIHLKVVLPSFRSSKWTFSKGVPHQIYVCISWFPIWTTGLTSWFHSPNNTRDKMCFIRNYPLTSLLFPKYFLQHFFETVVIMPFAQSGRKRLRFTIIQNNWQKSSVRSQLHWLYCNISGRYNTSR